MKNFFLLICGVALIAMVGCSKKDSSTPAGVDNKVLINNIFTAGMGAISQAQTKKSAEVATSPLYTYNRSVDYSVTGAVGGSIHVTGDITLTMNFDASNNFTGGSMLLGMTETITNYAFKYNGQTYTMNGAPYISLTGTFTYKSDFTFGTASSMSLGGGVRVVGPKYDQTININLSIIINSAGTGGHVSGTVGGESVNYSF